MKLDEEHLRKRFEQHEKQPPASVWPGVKSRIKRRGGSRTLLLVGIPSLVLALLGASSLLLNNGDSNHRPIAEQPDLAALTAQVDNLNDTNHASHDQLPNQPGKTGEVQSADNNLDSNKAVAGNPQKPKSSSNAGNQNQNTTKQKAYNREPTAPQPTTASKQQKARSSPREPAIVAQSGKLSTYPLLESYLGPMEPQFQPQDIPQVAMGPLPDSLQSGPVVKVTDSVKNRWQIGFALTPFITQYQYQNPSDFDQNAVDLAQSAESNGKGLRIGANLHYNVSHQLSIKTGLAYEYQRQDYEYGYTEQQIDTTIRTGIENDTNFQDPNYEIDTSYHERTLSRQNEYHRFSIPLTVRYQLMDNQRWHLFAEGGLRFTYLFGMDSRSVRLNELNNPGQSIKTTGSNFVNALNMRYSLQVGVGYRVNDSWSITAAPNIEAQAFSTFDSPDLLQRRAQQFGLSIGVIKSF